MFVRGIYIDEEISDIFYNQISFYDKINLTKTCKSLFSRYKDIVRMEVFTFINRDYYLFYECLKRFKYTREEQKKLMVKSMDVPPIESTSGIFMDLRFIFEICYNLKNYLYKNIYKKNFDENIKMQYGNTIYEKEYILQIMIKVICKCISFNRFETIQNIEKEMILFSLKRNFNPILWKTWEDKWTYLLLE